MKKLKVIVCGSTFGQLYLNYFVFIENGKVLWSDGWNRISRERLQRFFDFEGN